MSLVIIEGPDGSGKTTLANRLLKATGLPSALLRRSGPPGESLEEMLALIQTVSGSSVSLILDRHPLISEWVYLRTARRGESKESFFLQSHALEKIVSFLSEINPLIIYCRPPIDILRFYSRIESQMSGVHSSLESIAEKYDEAMQFLDLKGVRVQKYNFFHQNEDTIIHLVREHFQEGSNGSS